MVSRISAYKKVDEGGARSAASSDGLDLEISAWKTMAVDAE